MLNVLRSQRRLFLWSTLGGLALRLLFFVYVPAVTDDSRGYADFANNWLHHGVYGQTESGQIVAADTRLPGYPAFLALIFALFGSGNFRAVMVIQILFDLGTCWIIADLTRRTISERAAPIAFVLSALCPFLANYSAAVLTETLEIFFTVLALDFAVLGLDRLSEGRNYRWPWIGAGCSTGACILLRPDGGILLAAIGLGLIFFTYRNWRRSVGLIPFIGATAIFSFCALAPLAPWTIRNLRTLHHFQPLTPRYATEPEEFAAAGFNRWVRTWMAEYISVEEIYWNVPGDRIDADKLPSRAFDSEQQHQATLAVIDDYNQTQEMTPALDGRFDALAWERIRADRLRYYVVLPSRRIADMWLSPRIDLMPCDPRWWEFSDETQGSVIAVVFGLLNLAYIGAALMALIRRPVVIRYSGLLPGFVFLRSLFLGTLENPEARYTLECYPVVILLASMLIADCGSRRSAEYKTT